MRSLIRNLWSNEQIRRQFIVTALLTLPYEALVYILAFGLGFLGMGVDDSATLGKVVLILLYLLFPLVLFLSFLPVFWIGRTVRRLLGDTRAAIVAMGVMFVTLLIEVLLYVRLFT